jgi:hypothetical protein
VTSTSRTVPRPVEPDRLRHYLQPDRHHSSHSHPPVRDQDRSDSSGGLARWVSGRTEGERNRSLFWAACRLAEAGDQPPQIFAVLGPAAAATGLRDREIVATIASACRTIKVAPPGPSDGQLTPSLVGTARLIRGRVVVGP